MSRISASARSLGGWALALTVGAVIVVSAGSAVPEQSPAPAASTAQASGAQVSGIGIATEAVVMAPNNTWGD
ncbi:hypothetical protein [Streptomyces sp. 1331.2]|uniref:hypothetical protein n=1 Tax=Streptomyces sp. 1331.2 TaxID=1938835 RepID=UPI000BD52D4E|nr:hypothetical protein [Streptomyces sp. 1331.2]SOB81232.1 hypothetical protein SAMN06272789_1357 [Streptomyces sp. 1331.2]